MSLASRTDGVVGPLSTPKDIVVARLEEAGISVRRFIDLPEGSKQNDHDHTDPANHRLPDEVEGNYAVLCGDGLLVVDIDTHSCSFEGLPPELDDFPTTLTVQTPHGGEHRYYRVGGDLRGTSFPGIDIQGRGQYVVGPGSTLSRCSKVGHDCSAPGEGCYQILQDRPIAEVSVESIEELRSTYRLADRSATGTPSGDVHSGPAAATASEPPVKELQDSLSLGLAMSEFDRDYNPFSLARQMQQSKRWDRTLNLIQGRYADAGFHDDRSRAEAALVEEFGWWVGDDREIVWTMVDWVCRLNPQTDTRKERKWLERDGEWRETLFPTWFGNRETYDLRQIENVGEDRPTVSIPTKKYVTEALQELQEATTREITGHPRVDRGLRQVQRACKALGEEGVIQSHRSGRNRYYHLSGYPAAQG